jgi:hypothetical protein
LLFKLLTGESMKKRKLFLGWPLELLEISLYDKENILFGSEYYTAIVFLDKLGRYCEPFVPIFPWALVV